MNNILTLEKLSPNFYNLPTLELAHQLLGKVLATVTPEGAITAGLIVETEGYIATIDPACHAFTGKTPRNAVMWGAPGFAYVYFTYGNHWMINVVTEPDGEAAAVFIRAVQPIAGLELMRTRRNLHLLKGNTLDYQLTNGPGKLCAALDISGRLNGYSLHSDQIFIANPSSEIQFDPFEVVETTRIGITRAVELPWRYYVKGNRFVSKR